MESNTELKKGKVKKWIVILVVLIIVAATITTIKILNGKKDDKPALTIDESWGLGKNLTESVSNDKDYEWYANQFDTGEFGLYNSGPTVTEMASKWKDRESKLTAQDIRKKILYDQKKLMNKDELCKALNNNLINYKELYDSVKAINEKGKDALRKDLSKEEKDEAEYKYCLKYYINKEEYEKLKQDIKEEIKEGNIALIGMTTKYLTFNVSLEKRCGKYYDDTFFNWIVVKGYKVVDGKLYFEVYDPMGGLKYKDGTMCAKDRYYLANEVLDGYYYAISVSK